MKIFQEKLRQFFMDEGAADVGFATVEDAPSGLNHAISIVVKLSDAIIESIDGAPTHQYFHHYRTVNFFIDQTLLRAGFFLEREGYTFIPVAASQSINLNGDEFQALYSHKKVAVLAGLGTVGKNSLFLHHTYGARVRLGTIFTDCAFKPAAVVPPNPCLSCDLCVKACPSSAIKGEQWEIGVARNLLFDPKACSDYMKSAYKHIGRGAVCGICMKVCPYAR